MTYGLLGQEKNTTTTGKKNLKNLKKVRNSKTNPNPKTERAPPQKKYLKKNYLYIIRENYEVLKQ